MNTDQGTRSPRSASLSFVTAPPRPALQVLFVDADAERPEPLRRALPSSCVVGVVSSIRAALGAIAQRVPDLLVTDLDLPDGNGLQLLARVHQNPATRHVLLIVVTSRAMLGDKIAALEAGADDYLVRPVQPESFLLHVQLVSRFRRTLQR